MVISGNQQFLRTINRLAVLRSVRLTPGISRVRLSDELGLTRPTIGNLVEELVNDGWLTEEKTGPTGELGRRPVALRINDARRILIGADVNNQRIVITATTLGGDVRELSVTPTPSGEAKLVFDLVARLVSAMLERLATAGYEPCGIGIGVPGPVDTATGTLLYSDNTGWRELPVREMLATRLQELKAPPILLLVQRAVGCVALYNFEYERRIEEEPLMYVHVGHAVTSAIASRYSLLQGRRGLTGAIGHVILDPAGPQCPCGKRGCANTLVTMRALELASGRPSAEFRSAVQAEDKAFLDHLQTVGERFGAFLHNLCMEFDPARLFVGGPAFQEIGQHFLVAARKRFETLYAPSGQPAPRIEIVRHDANAVARGAATGVLYSLVHPHA